MSYGKIFQLIRDLFTELVNSFSQLGDKSNIS